MTLAEVKPRRGDVREGPIRTEPSDAAPPRPAAAAPQAAPPPLSGDEAALFFDLDGTLVESLARPDDVVADGALLELLRAANGRLAGRLGIVSGRSLAQLSDIFGSLAEELVMAGSHGAEMRLGGETFRPERPPTLDAVTEAMRAFAGAHAGVLLEAKSFGTALHYRLAPETEEEARRFARGLAAGRDLFVQEGRMMVELRAGGCDKGSAIRRLMAAPLLAGRVPVFAGDDLTDESGFAAVAALGGYGVLVGERRPSAARFHLDDPQAVRRWLAALAR